MTKANFLCLLVLSIVACTAEEAPARTSPDPDDLSVRVIYPLLEKLDGTKVTIRGYLTNHAPELILIENPSVNIFTQPNIVVTDLNLKEEIYDGDEFIDESDYFASLGCRDKYVELSGTIGFLPGLKLYGVVAIERIETFSSDDFDSKDRICFPVSNES